MSRSSASSSDVDQGEEVEEKRGREEEKEKGKGELEEESIFKVPHTDVSLGSERVSLSQPLDLVRLPKVLLESGGDVVDREVERKFPVFACIDVVVLGALC